MTQHIILYIKDGKIIDRDYLNSPVNSKWEGDLISLFEKDKDKKRRKKIIEMMELKPRHGNTFHTYVNKHKIIDFIMRPVLRLDINEELIIRAYTKYKWKSNIVTSTYRKSEGWSMEDGEEESKHTFDSKKNYDFVIKGNNDGGELDNPKTLLKIIRTLKTIRDEFKLEENSR